MTGDLRALRPIGNHLLVTALVLAALWLLASQDLNRLLVPPPDVTASEFLRAIEAHREPAAHRELTDELRERVPADELSALGRRLEARLGAVSQLDAETVDERDGEATVRATLRFQDGQERQLELPLVKQGGLWHVASVEPLRALAG
jgi:hypothetical protein